MQVHEIGRQALDELKRSGRLEDWANGHGDYAIVACGAVYNLTPTHFDLTDYYESEYWACHSAAQMQDFSLATTADKLSDYSSCPYYEVWHIVDDDWDWEQALDDILLSGYGSMALEYYDDTPEMPEDDYDHVKPKHDDPLMRNGKPVNQHLFVRFNDDGEVLESLRQLREAAVM